MVRCLLIWALLASRSAAAKDKHYSQQPLPTRAPGGSSCTEDYQKYPKWKNVHELLLNRDAEQAITISEAIMTHPEIDLIIAATPPALLVSSRRLQRTRATTKREDHHHRFASPQSIKSYCGHGCIYNWGLWDCVQGAMGCYILAAGSEVKGWRHHLHRHWRC